MVLHALRVDAMGHRSFYRAPLDPWPSCDFEVFSAAPVRHGRQRTPLTRRSKDRRPVNSSVLEGHDVLVVHWW